MAVAPIRLGLDLGSVNIKGYLIDESAPAQPHERSWCRPCLGKPLEVTLEILDEMDDVAEKLGDTARVHVGVTGVGADLLESDERRRVNELVAVSVAVGASHRSVRTIIDLGGQFTKWIRVDAGGQGTKNLLGRVGDFALNGLCAAGSGAFLEQQAARLGLGLDELGKLAASADRGATIAGRCSVFAKSDMIHLQQKGTPESEIAYGICLALVRTFAATVLQGRELLPPVALVGGGAANPGLVRAIMEVLRLDSQHLVVPVDHMVAGARGAALAANLADLPIELSHWLSTRLGAPSAKKAFASARTRGSNTAATLPRLRPPTQAGVNADAETPSIAIAGEEHLRAFLGIDVGSVSTNAVLLDEELEVLQGIYLPTRGRPVVVLDEALAQIEERFGDRIEFLGVGVTGSGRYLAEQLLGADLVKNEITAQLVSAAHYVPEVDTVFEIGGQDSKYINARGGHLRDFEMNKICAAGTGSFLEEQAERLGIAIEGEFAGLALEAASPVDLGSRCTVFMDAELCHTLARATPVTDLCAGLAYSVARNYLEKVVAGRELGEVIVFQGGTAANAAVVSAFEQLLGRPLQVHPFSRISGAVGAALLAAKAGVATSQFRGFRACHEHHIKSFECGKCENRCQVNRVSVGDRIAHFGDICERYTAKDRATYSGGPSMPFPELFALREKLLVEHVAGSDRGTTRGITRRRRKQRTRIGLVGASLGLEYLPFWAGLLDGLGFEPVIASNAKETSVRGALGLPPEVCLPLKIANGQVHQLLDEQGVERVLLPSVLELESRQSGDRCATCLFTQQLPDMVRLTWGDRVLIPQLGLENSLGLLTEAQRGVARALGVSTREVRRVWDGATERQRAFTAARKEAGRAAMDALGPGQDAVVVLGKPYNLHDRDANLNIARYLERLCLAAIPMDLLEIDDEPLEKGWYMLPWQLNRDQVRAMQVAAKHPRLFPLHVSSYGCGPDAFTVKHLERIWGNRPRLFLEFDEHRGEAGLVTRLEAFADEIADYSAHNTRRITRLRPPQPRRNLSVPPDTRCFLPRTTDHVYVYSGVLRSVGMDTTILPLPDAESLRLGEEFSSGRECHPYAIIAGDLAKLASRNDLREGDRYFTPSTRLPCLLGQYGDGFRMILEKLGETRLQVFDQHPGETEKLLGLKGVLAMYEGSTVIDYLIIASCQMRPREVVTGSVNQALAECFVRLEDTLARGGDPRDALAWSMKRLGGLELHPAAARPVVGVTGDLYTRINSVGNASLFERLEARGCTVWPSPFYAASTDFELPQDGVRWLGRRELKRALKEYGGALFLHRRAARLASVLDPELAERCVEPRQPALQAAAVPYVSANANHLVRSLVAKLVDFAARRANGAISAIGIGCMVGVAASAAIPKIRRDYGGVPMVSMAFGANQGAAQQVQLDTFVHQVHQHFEERKAHGRCAQST